IGRLSTRQIQSCGVTRQKTRYIEGLAIAVHEKRLSFRSLRSMTNEEARDHLLQLPGIGPWTADIYLLMALKRPDVWPVGDIALENTLKRLKPSLKQSSIDYAKRYWKPWRSVAARFLWHDYLCRRRSKS
ncbi:MAG: DNA-3-methyladenine glycosylase 2 family protein, partial [Candidatus Eisenbacteria bacterium]|nr:DNA-3-methyladenine glycosylase 2 family protein [Candidatus Eisenbacteria bacterium]